MNEYHSPVESTSEEIPLEPDGEPPEPGLRVMIANEQSTLTIDESRLQLAVEAVFRDSRYSEGSVSIAVVDDPTIHEINRQYLDHDYPTDVLSFVLEDRLPHLEGELVVSTDTAIENAKGYDWPASSELLLYIIHGALHLVGHRDQHPDETAIMHAAEVKYLRELGIDLPSNDSSRWSDVSKAPRS